MKPVLAAAVFSILVSGCTSMTTSDQSAEGASPDQAEQQVLVGARHQDTLPNEQTNAQGQPVNQ